jgi:hypothetical protein
MAITLSPAPPRKPALSPDTKRRLIAVAINQAGSHLPAEKPSLFARLIRALFR